MICKSCREQYISPKTNSPNIKHHTQTPQVHFLSVWESPNVQQLRCNVTDGATESIHLWCVSSQFGQAKICQFNTGVLLICSKQDVLWLNVDNTKCYVFFHSAILLEILYIINSSSSLTLIGLLQWANYKKKLSSSVSDSLLFCVNICFLVCYSNNSHE